MLIELQPETWVSAYLVESVCVNTDSTGVVVSLGDKAVVIEKLLYSGQTYQQLAQHLSAVVNNVLRG